MDARTLSKSLADADRYDRRVQDLRRFLHLIGARDVGAIVRRFKEGGSPEAVESWTSALFVEVPGLFGLDAAKHLREAGFAPVPKPKVTAPTPPTEPARKHMRDMTPQEAAEEFFRRGLSPMGRDITRGR